VPAARLALLVRLVLLPLGERAGVALVPLVVLLALREVPVLVLAVPLGHPVLLRDLWPWPLAVRPRREIPHRDRPRGTPSATEPSRTPDGGPCGPRRDPNAGRATSRPSRTSG